MDDQKSTQGKCVPTSALEDTCWQHSYSYEENTRNHSADFLQGLPCRDSPVLCRGSCSYPPRKNKPSAPTARSKAAGRSLAQHAAPGTPSLSQEWLCTAGHHTSWDGNTVAKKKLSIYHNVGFTQSTSKLCVP